MCIICVRRNNQFRKAPIVHCVFPLGLSRLFTLVICEWMGPPLGRSISTFHRVFKLSSDKSIKSAMKAAIREGHLARRVRETDQSPPMTTPNERTNTSPLISCNNKSVFVLRSKILRSGTRSARRSFSHLCTLADCDKITQLCWAKEK